MTTRQELERYLDSTITGITDRELLALVFGVQVGNDYCDRPTACDRIQPDDLRALGATVTNGLPADHPYA